MYFYRPYNCQTNMFKFMNFSRSSSEELPEGIKLLPPPVWRDSTKPWNRERPENAEASD